MRKILPPLGICVLDTDSKTRSDLVTAIRNTEVGRDSSTETEVVAFQSVAEIRSAFSVERLRDTMEPAILITDSIGVKAGRGSSKSFAEHTRGALPFMKIIVNSYHVDETLAYKLAFTDRVVDDCNRKDREGWPGLEPRILKWWQNYQSHNQLATMRSWIMECEDPFTRFWPHGTTKDYNLVDIYWQVVRNTPDGSRLRQAWDRLLDWRRRPLK
ncbi:MAG: hypothetical protein HN341_16550 [Verrucomicrobia bacterium]|nr:hypothetical protein [Verrucomicrobiota bacterium]